MDKAELHCTIRENSFIARIAALKLGSRQVAIVMGRTIHLHNAAAGDFLANDRWVRHEIAHVRQFQQYGFIPFLVKYLVESIKTGYFLNKYEAEARKAESDPSITHGISISVRNREINNTAGK